MFIKLGFLQTIGNSQYHLGVISYRISSCEAGKFQMFRSFRGFRASWNCSCKIISTKWVGDWCCVWIQLVLPNKICQFNWDLVHHIETMSKSVAQTKNSWKVSNSTKPKSFFDVLHFKTKSMSLRLANKHDKPSVFENLAPCVFYVKWLLDRNQPQQPCQSKQAQHWRIKGHIFKGAISDPKNAPYWKQRNFNGIFLGNLL